MVAAVSYNVEIHRALDSLLVRLAENPPLCIAVQVVPAKVGAAFLGPQVEAQFRALFGRIVGFSRVPAGERANLKFSSVFWLYQWFEAKSWEI